MKGMSSEFYETKVKDVMQKEDLPLIEKAAPVERVVRFLTNRTHVWVTEKEDLKKVVGVITEHDVLDILSPETGTHTFGVPDTRTLEEGTAEDVMTKGAVSCALGDTIEHALEKMAKNGIRRCPVIDESGIVLGEIRHQQILRKFSTIL